MLIDSSADVDCCFLCLFPDAIERHSSMTMSPVYYFLLLAVKTTLLRCHLTDIHDFFGCLYSVIYFR